MCVCVCVCVCVKRYFESSLLQVKMDTKPIAQSFCPEHSHHFDLSLPLASDHCKESFVLELMQKGGCTAVLEVWHKVLRSPQKVKCATCLQCRLGGYACGGHNIDFMHKILFHDLYSLRYTFGPAPVKCTHTARY